METEYPEHEKLRKIQDKSQEIGYFLDWLQSNGSTVCRWQDGKKFVDKESGYEEYLPEGYYPVRKSIEQWLAEFFEIDLNKIQQEKSQMLDEIRNANNRE